MAKQTTLYCGIFKDSFIFEPHRTQLTSIFSTTSTSRSHQITKGNPHRSHWSGGWNTLRIRTGYGNKRALKNMVSRVLNSIPEWYCWWFRSPENQLVSSFYCNSHYLPRVFEYIPGGAGFLPTTLSLAKNICAPKQIYRVILIQLWAGSFREAQSTILYASRLSFVYKWAGVGGVVVVGSGQE